MLDLSQDPGYDETRQGRFPTDSPMGEQYDDYKNAAADFTNAHSEYKSAARRHSFRRKVPQHVHRDLADKARHSGDLARR